MLLIDQLRQAMDALFRSQEGAMKEFRNTFAEHFTMEGGASLPFDLAREREEFFSYFTQAHVGVLNRKTWEALPVYEVDTVPAEELADLGAAFLARYGSASEILLPHDACFMETRVDRRRVGVLVSIEPRDACISLANDRTGLFTGMPANFVFAAWREPQGPVTPGPIGCNAPLYQQMANAAGDLGVEWVDCPHLIARLFHLFTGLAIGLQHPEWFERRKEDRSQINKTRQRKGKHTLASYTSIRLGRLFDCGETGISAAGGNGNGKRLHAVRAFPRIRRGKVELVRSHFRGDPSRGMVNHRRVGRGYSLGLPADR